MLALIYFGKRQHSFDSAAVVIQRYLRGHNARQVFRRELNHHHDRMMQDIVTCGQS